ncbi:DUF721 domain-containing protein [Aquamicrobium zhengzhouense]|uniref:DUF721 domain-containing protein n=1 Tax=Aquamicrobium zhengzhouense TaxID=2781738 RepID=A0ABS0SFD3_9HYPH|nr:DUF721 domain-containing protein [Aquamicrobium zhengzhouense]MBI1622009.1 DUF721 domain-containing protein [Aquamicrobium zhengzhouense]
MAGKRHRGNAVPVSDLAAGVLDPLLRKRAGINIGLLQSWEEIAGPRLAAVTRPEKIVWPRRLREDDPFEPATLVVACDGSAAFRLQHETGEIIARVNAFLGFMAVARIKIVQKSVAPPVKPKPKLRPLSGAEQQMIDGMVDGIEDEGLRQSLANLGRSMLGERR